MSGGRVGGGAIARASMARVRSGGCVMALGTSIGMTASNAPSRASFEVELGCCMARNVVSVSQHEPRDMTGPVGSFA
jgi:hypothetical protein